MTRTIAVGLLMIASLAELAADEPQYLRKASRIDTITATLKANGLPDGSGQWWQIGPFDNRDMAAFDKTLPAEKAFEADAKHPGRDGNSVGWQKVTVPYGKPFNLARYGKQSDDCACVLAYEFTATQFYTWPVWFGSDDTLTVWFNGVRVIHENVVRPAGPNQNKAELKVKAGINRLFVKVCNAAGNWEAYIAPELPDAVPGVVRNQLERDFPSGGSVGKSVATAEAEYYRIRTVPVPADVVMEVGGLGFRPDGKLLACTRRGEVWLIDHPESDDPAQLKFSAFATGLHESLGLHVENNNTVVVIQRPELTRMIDREGKGKADEFRTISDGWGITGDYHEYAFGPARDKDGNYFITLNVGFGGGHQSKAPWRGWCVKVSPDGKLTPWATGLRSPNGVNFSPDGELFYADNQGEWVATNKIHHLRQGEFYGHQAGLRWVKDSPFAGKFAETLPSGMLNDGQKGKDGIGGMPAFDPPAIWIPYGRLGQSASEMRWDTTDGAFGPFAGQMFIGDQTKALVNRVCLEKVNGHYQGAVIPFRSGFQCGVNRLCFAPHGALYVGETARGWGSIGPKQQGLERLEWTGKLPFEIHTVKLHPDGFKVAFTMPLDRASAGEAKNWSVQSYTYNYWRTYGSPEMDRRAESLQSVALQADGKSVALTVKNLKPGRVYEVRCEGVHSTNGKSVLHPEAYYTLNELVR